MDLLACFHYKLNAPRMSNTLNQVFVTLTSDIRIGFICIRGTSSCKDGVSAKDSDQTYPYLSMLDSSDCRLQAVFAHMR